MASLVSNGHYSRQITSNPDELAASCSFQKELLQKVMGVRGNGGWEGEGACIIVSGISGIRWILC